MLHRTVHLAAVFLFLQRLPLIVFLLTLSQGNVNLRASFSVNEHKRRHNGEADLLCGFLKLTYLTLRQQQLAV